jgi:amidase
MQGQGTRTDSVVTFTARRFKDKPATPQTHSFTPTVFYNYFSSTIPPVLSIFPGDTVES